MRSWYLQVLPILRLPETPLSSPGTPLRIPTIPCCSLAPPETPSNAPQTVQYPLKPLETSLKRPCDPLVFPETSMQPPFAFPYKRFLAAGDRLVNALPETQGRCWDRLGTSRSSTVYKRALQHYQQPVIDILFWSRMSKRVTERKCLFSAVHMNLVKVATRNAEITVNWLHKTKYRKVEQIKKKCERIRLKYAVTRIPSPTASTQKQLCSRL